MKIADDDVRAFPLPGARHQYGPDKTLDVIHIDLWLRPDLAARRLDAVCTLTLEAIDEDVASVRLDATDLRVSRVADDAGEALRYSVNERGLQVDLASVLHGGERRRVAVTYAVLEPRRGLYFIAPSAAQPDRPAHCWTQGQDQDSHFWFPCIDYPQAKQTTSATIVVPIGQFALSNGRLIERRDDVAAGTTTFRYEQEVPHAAYLVTLVAGSFSEIEQRNGSVPTFYYVFPGREADGERSFGKTPKMLAVFEEKIGVKYPYARYSQIAVSDFVMGGMENTTATTQTDRTLHDARAHLDVSSDPLVAHELAHQWFGNLLTCRDWSQAWLNEGFATFFEAVFREADLGYDEYAYDVFGLVQQYLDEDSSRYRRAVVCNIYHAPLELFDAHLYQKSGAILHMLRGELGDTRFWRSIRRYVNDNAARSVETIDLIRAIEAATGRNTRRFFDQWILRGGHPALTVSAQYDDVRKELTITIEQKQKIDAEAPAYVFDVVVGYVGGDLAPLRGDVGAGPLAGEQRMTLTIERQAQTFSLPCAQRPALVRVDSGAFVLGTWEYKIGSDWSLAALRSDPSPIARIRAARALAKDDAPAAREALVAALSGDPFWGVSVEVAHELGKTRAAWARAALLAQRNTAHPKTRRAVVAALGAFDDRETASALIEIGTNDESYVVCAAALTSLGKTRDARAFDVLVKQIDTSSWRDTIARGAVAGLAELADERALDVVLPIARDERRADDLRVAALDALARITWLIDGKHPRIIEAIVDAFADPLRNVAAAAIGAAATTADTRLVPGLRDLADRTGDPRFHRSALVAIRTIEEGQRTPPQLSGLRTELETLRADHRSLLERVERLDAR